MTRSDSARIFRAAVFACAIALAQACSPPDDTPELREPEPAPSPEEAVGDVDDVPETVSEERLLVWNVSLDAPVADSAAVQVIDVEDGVGFRTGDAALAWRAADLIETGDFSVSGDFRATGASADDAAYGIFVGGLHLEAPDRSYLAFLIRGDGQYRIERRDGQEDEVLVDWQDAPAIGAAPSGAMPQRSLSIQVQGDQVRFLANGRHVHTLTTEEAQPHGLAGLRSEEAVDLKVRNWTVSGAGVVEEPVDPTRG